MYALFRRKSIKVLALVTLLVFLVGLHIQLSRHTKSSSLALSKNSLEQKDDGRIKINADDNQKNVLVYDSKDTRFRPDQFKIHSPNHDRHFGFHANHAARETTSNEISKQTTSPPDLLAGTENLRISQRNDDDDILTSFKRRHRHGDDVTKDIAHNDVDEVEDTRRSNQIIPFSNFTIARLSTPQNIRPNPLNSSRSSTAKEYKIIESRFEERNRDIQKVCNDKSYKMKLKKIRGTGRRIPLAFDRLSVCLVPKAGTTYIIYQLRKTLKHKKEGKKHNFMDFDYKHDRKHFLVAREPYGRLVSAYFSKVVSHPKWWISLGRFIVGSFRPNPSEKSSYCGHDVTFPEFIRYFILAQKLDRFKNNHFVPIHEICNPCQFQWQNTPIHYVAHLETMKDDMKFILDSVNVTTNDNFRFDPVKTIVGHLMNSRDERHDRCGGPWCPTFQRVWWALQSNGHISNSIPMPLKGMECDNVTADEMIDLALKGEAQSKGTFDKASQKREAVANLYAQVSLADRKKVRDALELDFKLFGYDPQPDFVFSPLEIEELRSKEFSKTKV